MREVIDVQCKRRFRPSRDRRRGGWSFIELMVVLGILSALMGIVVAGIAIWIDQRQAFDTRNTIHKARMTVESWKLAYDAYPPSAMTRMAAVVEPTLWMRAPDNETNEGIETVYQALHWPGFRGRSDWQPREVGNTDDDALREGPRGRAHVPLLEFLDAYGNPLVYFHRDDYAAFASGGAHYVSADGEVEPRPHRDETGEFRNPSTFQVFSMGADGVPNTDDDIGPWSR